VTLLDENPSRAARSFGSFGDGFQVTTEHASHDFVRGHQLLSEFDRGSRSRRDPRQFRGMDLSRETSLPSIAEMILTAFGYRRRWSSLQGPMQTRFLSRLDVTGRFHGRRGSESCKKHQRSCGGNFLLAGTRTFAACAGQSDHEGWGRVVASPRQGRVENVVGLIRGALGSGVARRRRSIISIGFEKQDPLVA